MQYKSGDTFLLQYKKYIISKYGHHTVGMIEESGKIRILLDNGEREMSVNLKDILFDTDFLDSLYWSAPDGVRILNPYEDEYGSYIGDEEYRDDYYAYHKINLALLDSDRARVDYIEKNTLLNN